MGIEDLTELYAYNGWANERVRYSSRLWRAMLHVVNHSSYHRGQIAAMLRQVGATPQGTDLMLYYREQSR